MVKKKKIPRAGIGRRIEDKVDDLVPVVFELVGKVGAMLTTNIIMICLTLLVGIVAYIGRDAQASNIQNNKSLSIENSRKITADRKANKVFRKSVKTRLDETNKILRIIQKNQKR